MQKVKSRMFAILMVFIMALGTVPFTITAEDNALYIESCDFKTEASYYTETEDKEVDNSHYVYSDDPNYSASMPPDNSNLELKTAVEPISASAETITVYITFEGYNLLSSSEFRFCKSLSII